MNTILALALIIAQLIGASPELADEWPLFPEHVTWASTPEDICETQGFPKSRIMCYETFQMLHLESADIPALEGEYPDVSFVFACGEMVAAAWQLDERDALMQLWDGLSASCRKFKAPAPDTLAGAVKYLLGSQTSLVELDGARVLNAGNGLVFVKQSLDDESAMLFCLRISRLNEMAKERSRLAGEASRGFDSPEDCVKAISQALYDMDAKAFLDCFAIEETARRFDLHAYLERVSSLQISTTLFEPENEINIAINEAYLKNDTLRRLARGSQVLAGHWKSSADDMPLFLKDSSAEELASRTLSTQELGKLTFKSVADAASFSENYAQSYARGGWRYLAYGFDCWREIVVTLDFEGKTAYMPLGLANVNGRWLAAPFSPIISSFVNMPNTLIVTEDLLQ